MSSQISLGYTQTALSGATALSALVSSSVFTGGIFVEACDFVILEAEAQAIRWTDDGVTTPTTSVGQLLAAGNTLVIVRSQFGNFQVFPASAGAIANTTAYHTG
jgi:hypothetical protein